MNRYKRIIIKISGEALEDKTNHEIYDLKVLNNIAKTILELTKMNIDVGVVVGGGNIFRGKESEKLYLNKIDGDYMGMLATILNGLALKNILNNNKVKCQILSALPISKFAKEYSISRANKYLLEKNVLIFTGGIGHPFFTTDTCSALRAKEINCDGLLMAKNGVDGVYDDDPKINKKAKLITSLKYSDILEKDLKVIDNTAASLLIKSGIKTHIFNIDNPDNIIKIIKGDNIGTIITD